MKTLMIIVTLFANPVLAETVWRCVEPDGNGLIYTNNPDVKCRVGHVSIVGTNFPETPPEHIRAYQAHKASIEKHCGGKIKPDYYACISDSARWYSEFLNE